MLYCENWPDIQKRYIEYWAKENHDRPILNVKAPKTNQKLRPVSKHATLKERWTDIDYILKCADWEMQNTFFGAEAFPMFWPNLGPDIFAALYGTDLEFGEDTSWAIPHLTDCQIEEFKGFQLQKQGEYYRKIIEMTDAVVEHAKEKYIAGITDLHPGADGLVSMRGPQELCFDSLDYPEFIKKGSFSLFEGFKEIYEELYKRTTKYQQGSTNWMGIWHPDRWYVTSCDFCCMISEDMFEEAIVEELEAEIEFLDASIYHLDGPGALKHLDRLLKIDKLNGIQWVYGAGQPTASHWMDVLHKIQDAGKLIQVNVEPNELEFMLQHLRPEGVMYNVYASSEEEAKALLKMSEKVRYQG